MNKILESEEKWWY